jgi:hypothetical protein
VSCLQALFVVGQKHATVERALDFAAKFCVCLYDDLDNDEDMPPFLKKLFEYLLEVG